MSAESKQKITSQKFNYYLSVFEIAIFHYLGAGFLVLIALFIYLIAYPYQINQAAKLTLEYLTISYLVIAPFYYIYLALWDKISYVRPSRTYLAAIFFWQLPIRLFQYRGGALTLFPDVDTQRAVLAVVVKFFFAPLMISFFFSNLDVVISNFSVFAQWVNDESNLSAPDVIWRKFYLVSFHFLMIIDTAIFAFAYLVESDKLGNKILSVDTTLSGWASALVCYPPLNFFMRQFFSTIGVFVAPGRNLIVGLPFFILLQIVALALFVIYVWAGVALGTRAGNLVNRGIVARGPYRYIRHPAYAAKNLAWFFEILPFFHHPLQVVYWAIWVGIYVARAITEERHLAKDPSYVAYSHQVRYRFIPGIL